MFSSKIKGFALVALLLTGVVGCQDLDVTNLNDPDRFRALANPEDLQALIAGNFDTWFDAAHGSSRANLFANYATEMTSTTNLWGFWSEGQEPRVQHGNLASIPAFIGVFGPRHQWSDMLEVLSVSDDLLRATEGEEGVEIILDGVDYTPRARAMAKFLQGLAWGYLGLMFDQAMVIPETEEVPTTAAGAQAFIIPHDDVIEAAIGALDAANDLVQEHDIVYPSRADAFAQWFGTATSMSPADFAELVNTLKARFLVLNARTPQERANVDWTRVLQFTQNGLTSDFDIVLDANRESTLFQVAQDETLGCTSCFRWDNRLIGQSDISGAYQDWIGSDFGDRNRFDIVTPDRRITGPEVDDAGSYTRYLEGNGCCLSDRGLYFRSAYQWRRHAHEVGVYGTRERAQDMGVAHLATADENRLYEAEALYYTNDLQGAANLINVTRTREQTVPPPPHSTGETYPGLPPVTVDGAPHSAPGADDCVPRTDSGECGSLLVALRYERMIENAGIDAIRGWLDSRGFGLLPDHSWIELPIPANELEQLGLPLYSFGGIGGESSAVYDPVE